MRKWFTQKNRAYIYRVLVALGAVAGVYGFASGEELLALGGFAAVLFNVMPTANTSTHDDQ